MPTCVVCDEVITHPLCQGCLEQQIGSWLQERFPNRTDLRVTLEDLSGELSCCGGVTTCIKCKRPMRICSHCYLTHILAWIEQVFPQLVGEFCTYFGFEGQRYVEGRRYELVIDESAVKPLVEV